MDRLNESAESFMALALQEAQRAFDAKEVPVGAVMVRDGQVIARAHNQVEMLKDATAHAEVLAITQAANALGGWRLEGVTMYVTKEPCAMCAGALVNSRVDTVVFGCADPRAGAAGSALDVTGHAGMLHRVDVIGGVLQEECRAMLQEFFKLQRDG